MPLASLRAVGLGEKPLRRFLMVFHFSCGGAFTSCISFSRICVALSFLASFLLRFVAVALCWSLKGDVSSW